MKYIKTFEQFVNEDLVNENITPSQMKSIAKDIVSALPNHTKSEDGRFNRKQIIAAFKYVPNSNYINSKQKSEIADIVEKILGSSFIKESKIQVESSDEFLDEAKSVDVMYALKTIKEWNRTHKHKGDYDDLAENIIKNLGYKPNKGNILKVSDHLAASVDKDDKVPEDKDLIDEIYSLLEEDK